MKHTLEETLSQMPLEGAKLCKPPYPKGGEGKKGEERR